jgi:hypothetical protein
MRGRPPFPDTGRPIFESCPLFFRSVTVSHRLTRIFLAASLLFLPAACGEEEHGDVELAPETLFPLRYLTDVGITGTGLPQQGIRGIGFGTPFLDVYPGAPSPSTQAALVARLSVLPEGALAVMVLTSPTCNPDIVGAAVDTDGDGIPNDATTTYTAANCTVYDSATGNAYLGRGSYRLRDTNDDRYGFRFEMTNVSVRQFEGDPIEFTEVHYNVTETANTTATGGTYRIIVDAASLSGDYISNRSSARRIRWDITQGFVPVGTIPLGGPLPDGTLTVSGTMDLTLSDYDAPARMKLNISTTVPLIYDDGCGGFTSGAHEMRLNGSTTEGVHVVFAACVGHYEPIGAGTL